ncbi:MULTISPECIES: DNA-3-methyladenine glycosylase I [unclassified Microcella]|uniref:DNA-3-methyladenine glycosylase I n=1 Tax=unclassified Microcella TaxID=2630066 RepID=UPI0006F4DDEC|nr:MULTISPECIES: DNA-3-methyladenine glycosylase I [unclassified Microcella]KQV24747.1 3-methyladenine DNA glycosylase [Yonghaparkia sp. Root332]KRF31036.1 3-methyladenine DNA glycosylase [Yonghaparkia sp. Soil809]
MGARIDLVVAADGRARCGWAGDDPEYRRYHDEEWGRELRGDRALFEKLSLEAFQSGLSWITVLKRREGFRAAFAGFEPEAVAAFDETDADRLMNDVGIIRNRAKISATIANAQVIAPWVRDEPGALDALIWSHAPAHRAARPRSLGELPATTPESIELARALKARGLRFVGPTTAYALMQSAGLVDDHLDGCWRADSAVAEG